MSRHLIRPLPFRLALTFTIFITVSGCGQSSELEDAQARIEELEGQLDASTTTTVSSPLTTTTQATSTTTQRPTTTATQATTTTPEPENSTLKLLDVIVWDDTKSNPPDVEVWVEGHGSWFPDLTFGGDGRLVGEFPVGVAAEFLVYPDGRAGTEIRVPFMMTEEIISGSDRDKVSVAIEDDKVVVFGTPIVGLEIEFTR